MFSKLCAGNVLALPLYEIEDITKMTYFAQRAQDPTLQAILQESQTVVEVSLKCKRMDAQRLKAALGFLDGPFTWDQARNALGQFYETLAYMNMMTHSDNPECYTLDHLVAFPSYPLQETFSKLEKYGVKGEDFCHDLLKTRERFYGFFEECSTQFKDRESAHIDMVSSLFQEKILKLNIATELVVLFLEECLKGLYAPPRKGEENKIPRDDMFLKIKDPVIQTDVSRCDQGVQVPCSSDMAVQTEEEDLFLVSCVPCAHPFSASEGGLTVTAAPLDPCSKGERDSERQELDGVDG